MTKLTAKQWSEFYYEQPYQLEQYFKSVDAELAHLRQQAATLADALELMQARYHGDDPVASCEEESEEIEMVYNALAAYKESK